jgi:predicted nucleic acid-binding protein
MGVIVDTSIWVDIERGRLAPGDVASVTGNEPVYVAPSIIAELEYGIHRAKNSAQRRKRALAVARIKDKPCLVIDAGTGAILGQVAAELDGAGTPSAHRIHDLWIAALALQHNLKVLTHNPRDFENIPGLEVLVMPRNRPQASH